MDTHRPSLLPALVALATQVTQIEVGPQFAALMLALANIAAATVLGILGQRLRKVQQQMKQAPRQRRKKLRPQDTVLTPKAGHHQ